MLAGQLDWRQVAVLRALVRYLRQVGLAYSLDYVANCLLANVGLTRLIVRLFEARFAPTRHGHEDVRAELVDALVEETHGALDGVDGLDADRILRALLSVVRAVVRTNAYQAGADGRRHEHLSFKLTPRLVAGMPEPAPHAEVWVYSPRVEGVHLRFGEVARGGLRWSDRREDFRTEVLGLVKAQIVKNAVIVPTGAKGGFVAKRLPDPAVDRDAWWAEGIASYRTFISGLLDITDDLRVVEDDQGHQTRVTVPPVDVVRYDGDDPYLVVAADKGTASFSDIANEIALSRGFWLGDAFASGGSVGYDHKAMGITARGAWESVRRHFRELGHDTQAEPFTVVGVGDMSGDVFGNGMLLSDRIRLRGGLRPPARVPRPRPGPGGLARGAGAVVRPAPFLLGGLRRLADLRRGRGLLADGEVGARQPAGRAAPRPGRGRALDVARGTAEGGPGRTGRPVLERRDRHLRQGLDGVARRGRRQGQRRHPHRRPRPAGEGRR